MHLIIGTGKVGLPLAQLFHASNIPALSTTRSGNVPSPLAGVPFDWNDPLTFDNAFSRAEAASDVIQSIFMTPPFTVHMLPAMKPFIDFAAKEKGVKRFVLLSASLRPASDPIHGAVHKYLQELGVEYAAIRPSWFFQNFPFSFYYDLANGTIISSTGSSKIGFVDPQDIAEAAFHAMTDEEPLNGSYILFGPELLSYADVAKILSSISGRTITHRNISQSEFKKHAMQILPESFADSLATLEVMVKNGAEERLFLDGPAVDGKEKEEIWKGKRTRFEGKPEINTTCLAYLSVLSPKVALCSEAPSVFNNQLMIKDKNSIGVLFAGAESKDLSCSLPLVNERLKISTKEIYSSLELQVPCFHDELSIKAGLRAGFVVMWIGVTFRENGNGGLSQASRR
ncbi:NAD(P)-binding protein [Gymnopus androsaceus JB14]|uniref:NAD(P)-binding protein n=1 Tax=Gymnopus androsaceus JB14 TaxID=1447944 RepID=A0A6A4GIW3_9AGAR|nr:NAD(P)-binding protein [Gymnopus androsaceus JB14]